MRSLYLIAVLHVLTFSTILCELPNDLPPEDLEVRYLIYETSGFLAGENTPVWLATKTDNDANVIYTKLEKGIMKKAYDYYKSDQFNGISTRARRNVDDDTYNTTNYWNPSNEPYSTLSISEVSEQLVEKRESRETKEVYHPTVLIVMDYDDSKWPSNTEECKKFIYKKILYALAFFNGVDLQLRHIQNPYVRLRIAGIVIGRNRAAIPYLRENQSSSGLNVRSAHAPMINYWRNLAWTNADFPMASYDIVATMTDSPLSGEGFFNKIVYGVGSPGTPCISSGPYIGGVIVSDDHAFKGIKIAVHEISHVLGGVQHDGDTSECSSQSGYVMSKEVGSVGRTWSACSLRIIASSLRGVGWCLKDPKEFHPPGPRIPAILPGKLMPAWEQCKTRGWNDAYVCWNYLSCDYLYCSNIGFGKYCTSSGPAIDGTTCQRGKMCLDGKCVSNMTIHT